MKISANPITPFYEQTKKTYNAKSPELCTTEEPFTFQLAAAAPHVAVHVKPTSHADQ